ncbi:hypothetical protein NESM_000155900 [Novymonas esmeraldas]|uniref:REH2 DRSM domain-containing protein n=1 Tax=Novymonas esmeraldas TaxID=1808958 RepID=A0AAW0F6G2_9TRYP
MRRCARHTWSVFAASAQLLHPQRRLGTQSHSSLRLTAAPPPTASCPPCSIHNSPGAPPQQPLQDACKLGNARGNAGPLIVRAAGDVFAQSRIKNYLQRVASTAASCAAPAPAHTTGRSTASPASISTTPRRLNSEEVGRYSQWISGKASETAWISYLDLPVDVLVESEFSRQVVTAVGVAVDAKMAVVAACMHAEYCLDALNIPLYTSERRQRQHALQAQAQGRTAPELGAAPMEMSSVKLPCGVFLPDATTADIVKKAATWRTFQPTPPPPPASAAPSTPGTSAVPPRGRRRAQRHWETRSPRFGTGVFLRSVIEELNDLHSVLFQHNSPPVGDDDDDGAADAGEMDISLSDVQLLPPEVLAGSRAGGAAAAAAAADDRRGSVRDGAVPSRPLVYQAAILESNSSSVSFMVDESEGGAFTLVECVRGEWLVPQDMPSVTCVLDPGALPRVDKYLMRVTGHGFAASVQLRQLEEDTNLWSLNPQRVKVSPKTWYTVHLDLRGIPVPAVGKSVSQEVANDLCAMHAELLLQWFGVHVYEGVRLQAMYCDACLQWGRLMAPEPVDPATVDVATANLPKPMKHLYQNQPRIRKRCAERSTAEKLLRLNRIVVCLLRQHLIEVSIINNPDFAELLSLAMQCLRSFMVATRHPYESAIHCFKYSAEQFRCTVYLPLPEQYGIRGGYAIGDTPQSGRELCALHAIDILCALDLVPAACMEQPRWQRMMEVREGLGMILPPTYEYAQKLRRATTAEARAALGSPPPPPHHHLRSPPAYREVPGGRIARIPPLREVWQVMLMDASGFDVAPDWHSIVQKAVPSKNGFSFDTPSVLFEEFAEHTFGWKPGDKRRFMMCHYAGPQLCNGKQSTISNNFWMELPLDPAVYGRRVALGRCIGRKGAERMVYIHALRIAYALKLIPWETLSTRQLADQLYKNDVLMAQQRQRQWRWMRDYAIECSASSEEKAAAGDAAASKVPEAVVTHEIVTSAPATAIRGVAHAESERLAGASPSSSSAASAEVDLRHVLSPYPVLSHELAMRLAL